MRKLLSIFLLLGILLSFGGCAPVDPEPPARQDYIGEGPWIVNPLYDTDDVVVADVIVDPEHYAVDPTGHEDSTRGIQLALSYARRMNGGTVWLPAGQYRITGRLTIPPFVTLRGDWQDPDTGNAYGTVLMMDIPIVSETDMTGSITISGSAGVIGLTVYYPNQSLDDIKPYPFTFYVNGVGEGYMLQSIVNCTLINAYKGIGACVLESNPHEMMTVENVKGTVLSIGAEVYNQADVGTWKNVTFKPDYWANAPQSYSPPEKDLLADYTRKNAVGLKLGDLEWTQFAHIRLSDFYTGIHIVKGKRIQFAGSLYDVQVSNCDTALLADDMDPRWGTVIAKSTLSGNRSLINHSGGEFRLAGVTLNGSSYGKIIETKVDASQLIDVPQRAPLKPASYLKLICADNSGQTDVSSDVQAALDALAKTGGIAYLPAGLYRLDKPITVPAGVELRGASGVAQREQSGNSDGTLFLVYPKTVRTPLEASLTDAMVTLSGDNAGIRGVRFLYPLNITAAANGKQIDMSGYTIRGKGDGVYAINVAITGGYNGIDFRNCDNHMIKKFVGSCVQNAMFLGGSNGLVEGCLQNGNTFCRMGISKKYVTAVNEAEVFSLVFDPILRRQSVYLMVDHQAQGQTIFNSFAYGVKTFLYSGGDATVFNIGGDNIGSSSPMLDIWGGNLHVTNMMRYNGISYACKNARLTLYNRLTIANTGETPYVIYQDE